jgi:hypothetical protein
MGQITTETIACIRRAVDAGQAPPLTLWEFRQLAFLAERQIAQPASEPVAWDEKCVLGHCGSPSGCERDMACRANIAQPAAKQAEPPANTNMKRDEWGALSSEAQKTMREAVRARSLKAAQGAASIRDVSLGGAQAEPVARDGWAMVPVEPTLEMIAAYLTATDLYWKRTDQLPTPPNKWRTGTPTGATAEGYRAMLAASSTQPRPQPLSDEQINDAYGSAKVQHDHIPHDDVVRIARAIEAAHGITAQEPTK